MTKGRELAELLNDIIGEQIYPDSKLIVSEDALKMTALAIQNDIDNGVLKPDEFGSYYYAGMVEDYGGYIDRELDPNEVADVVETKRVEKMETAQITTVEDALRTICWYIEKRHFEYCSDIKHCLTCRAFYKLKETFPTVLEEVA